MERETMAKKETHTYTETDEYIEVDGYKVNRQDINRGIASSRLDETTRFILSKTMDGTTVEQLIALKMKEEHDAAEAKAAAEEAAKAAAAAAIRQAKVSRCKKMFESGEVIILDRDAKLTEFPDKIFTDEEFETIVEFQARYASDIMPFENLAPAVVWNCTKNHPGYRVIITKGTA